MAPGYRTATTTRRGNRSGYAELDDYEGLPVRQWRLEEVDIAPPPVQTTAQKNDRWSIELPHGMPKDYHLLPAHSKDLLRAARSGALYKRKAPPEEEDSIDVLDKALVTDADKAGDKKTSAGRDDAGIKVKVWKRVAREIEVPSHSYLAKRHKNTITLPSKASATQFSGPTVTRVTVRRIDAAGNAYERTITINDDEQMNHLDGEIVSTTVIAAPVAADPVAQQQPTPTRKRPPPPPHKKKHKGPGRGRKKKLGFVSLPLPAKPGASANSADAADGATEPKTEASASGADGIKREESTGTPDVEMGENSAVASDDDEGDDDEGEEGEEGDGNEGQADDTMADATEQGTPADRQDQEMGDADESADVIRPSSIEEPAESSQGAEAETETYNMQTSVPLGTPHLGVGHLFSPKQHEGSPLKNVVLQSPTEPKSMDFPSIMSIQETSTFISDAQPAPGASTTVTETVQQKTETAGAGLAMVEMSAQTNTINSEALATGSTEGRSSLPDLRSPSATSASKDEVLEVTHETTGDKQAKTQVAAPSTSQQSYQASSASSLLPSLREPPKSSTHPPTAPPMVQSRPVQEDDGLDLLGGLERELDRQSRTNTNTPAEQAAQAPATGDKTPLEDEKAPDHV